MLISFLDFHIKSIIRLKILFNLLWRQLNKHSCNFWGLLWSCHSNNVVINALTNLVFQVRVLIWNSWNEFYSLKLISLRYGHLLNVLLGHHWHSRCGNIRHWCLWLWDQCWLGSLGHSLVHSWHLLMVLLIWTLVLMHLVVLIILILISIILVKWSLSSVSLMMSISLVHLGMSQFICLNNLQKWLKHLG